MKCVIGMIVILFSLLIPVYFSIVIIIAGFQVNFGIGACVLVAIVFIWIFVIGAIIRSSIPEERKQDIKDIKAQNDYTEEFGLIESYNKNKK